jgi:hypothetical protein
MPCGGQVEPLIPRTGCAGGLHAGLHVEQKPVAELPLRCLDQQ